MQVPYMYNLTLPFTLSSKMESGCTIHSSNKSAYTVSIGNMDPTAAGAFMEVRG